MTEPCKKDQLLCDLYSQLLGIKKDCFDNDKIKFTEKSECANEILDLIYSFSKKNEKYELDKTLVRYLKVINQFKEENKEEEIYIGAVKSLDSVLEYLFKTGQCDCKESSDKGDEGKGETGSKTDPNNETLFNFSEITSFQSSHLYLQAAGSTGDDSTEGIHLRWALKNGLAQHLPKGNYATTNANLNKPNDFVKVYRAPYTKISQVVDLTKSPSSVDDVSGVWTYQVGNFVFDVKFISTAKYLSVRQTIDPANNPTSFLVGYGSEVIEIENKTELSFAVTPNLVSNSPSSTVKIELLSSEENKITALKLASYRKKHTSQDISGNQLLSENIRSIRLSITDGSIESLEFELYSTFISLANTNHQWNPIGSYALTKDDRNTSDNEAYQRLEPNVGDIDNWLRYNDGAKVNVNNYKEKWNGASVPVDNQLVSTVDTYINLSDVATNPTAIESVFINDQTSTPTYNPSDEKFDLSNLYILQLASLDYHIARMLGLGTLDLEDTILEGKYLYLAEYDTVGDLNDGLGARQVQHLYCSLPTDLNDQRLPLPIELKTLVPGVISGLGTDSPKVLTDAQGYSEDGKTRFLSLFNEELPNELPNQNFYHTNYEFDSSKQTIPVYAGIEYKKSIDSDWIKPELSHDKVYKNIDITTTVDKTNETLSIVIPEPQFPLFVHRERENGWHDYSSYGINWFSRAASSSVVRTIETTITPTNKLHPPTNINAVLIRKENPLLLTSSDEQVELESIIAPGVDETFIRLTYEYNHGQELIDYHKEIDGVELAGFYELPDSDELFADELELFFRTEEPKSVSGKISLVTNNANPLLCDIETDVYIFASSGGVDSVTPTIVGNGSNFVGSLLTVDDKNYLIHQVDNSGTHPKFTILKNDRDGNPIEFGAVVNQADLTSPGNVGLFIVVENMQTVANWDTYNPISTKVNIDHTTIHKENIVILNPDHDPTQFPKKTETHLQKFRGIYEDATITEFLENDYDNDGNLIVDTTTGNAIKTHQGIYELTFNGFSLAEHSQESGTNLKTIFHNGVVRIHSQSDVNGPRRVLRVIKTEEIGTTNDLKILVIDDRFIYKGSNPDKILIGVQKVNYYPGYKSYLYHDVAHKLTKSDILPAEGEGIKYSIWGIRSFDSDLNFYSKFSIPTLMFAQEIVEPLTPEKPKGPKYATRPDFFGKASFTFTTEFTNSPDRPQKPHSIQFFRASDIQILTALYRDDEPTDESIPTVDRIRNILFEKGHADWYEERWENLLSLDYTYPSDPTSNGLFKKYPNTTDGERLPLPNSIRFIASINAFIDNHNTVYPSAGVSNITDITSLHQVIIPAGSGYSELKIDDFITDVVGNSFVPLTEIPVIFKHIKDTNYTPIPKKQNVRNKNGELMDPSNPEFDMAPMMKLITSTSGNHTVQFTDFGIDGASNAKYLYASKEINMQMKTSSYSPVLGPVHLVNTNPPQAPEIAKIVAVMESKTLGIDAGIEIQFNGYREYQNVKKINIYRSNDPKDVLSIRTMKMVKEIDVDTENLTDEASWTVKDNFSDLTEIPYGDPFYYRITVSREVKYQDKNDVEVIEYAPSSASKVTLTNIVENYSPPSPKPVYISLPLDTNNELHQVMLHWQKTCYKAKYHVYKMNTQGNWVKIHELQTNDNEVYLELKDTDWGTHILETKNSDNENLYHHFKVISENTSGMLSTEENIITAHNEEFWQEYGGIGSMTISPTFIIR